MDYKEPKTRKEAKGRDKQRDGDPYSQKRVRQLEAILEKRNATKAPSKAKN